MPMEKVRRIIMIIVFVLTVFLTVSIIYLIIDSINNSEETNNKETTYKLTSEEKESLLELVDTYDRYLITLDGSKEIENLTDKDKINFIDRMSQKEKDEFELDFNKGVKLEKIEEVLKKYFGPKVTFHPVNSTCFLEDGDFLIYDTINKIYKSNNEYHAHSAYIPPSIVNYYVDGKRIVDNDKLIYVVTLKKAFAWPNTSIYYGNYTDLANGENKIVDLYEINENYEESDITSFLEDYKSNLSSYTYVFETSDSISNSYIVNLTKLNKNNKI